MATSVDIGAVTDNLNRAWDVPAEIIASVPAPPTGVEHELIWNVAAQLGAVRTDLLLRARAMDVSLLGNWSEAMPFTLDSVDFDHDGMPDLWEIANGFDPNNPTDAAQDADGDGFSNYAEHLAATDPRNAASLLRMTSIHRANDNTRIDWQGGLTATQYLQTRIGLATNYSWLNLFTNFPPTPATSSFTNLGNTNWSSIYRIRIDAPTPGP